MNSLELGIVGNGTLTALVDAQARVVWSCLPRMDGDPAFCALLQPKHAGHGVYAVELENLACSRQRYLPNSAVLVTELEDRDGGIIEMVDFAPRYWQYGRIYHPLALLRRLRVLAGAPRIRIILRPLTAWGAGIPERTWGSNHVRYLLDAVTMRLSTDVPVPYLLEETAFVPEREHWLVFGPDETLRDGIAAHGRHELECTLGYWHDWVRYLALPVDWQDAVIRAAITLKLCCFEETGAVIAAMTTSIPEAAGTERNWDYRYCWLRDAYFVVNALNRLSATGTMEEYLDYISNIAAEADDSRLQPVYGIALEKKLIECTISSLRGYRNHRPVRIGNQAYEHVQNDIYGSVIMAATQAFFDLRLAHPGDQRLFERLENLGRQCTRVYNQPDASLWEFRGFARVHTFSAVMCWAGCDRLARIADRIGLHDRAQYWRSQAERIRAEIMERAYDPGRNTFVGSFGGSELDASLLLLHDLQFLAADDPRFIGTVEAVEKELRRGNHMMRYVEPDDFGQPQNAFNICTFWMISALAAIGRKEDARAMFEEMLRCRNHLGLLSEDTDPRTGEMWGNFPQTYSMVGIIHSAMVLSKPWEEAF